jgi:molybdopterin synthase sulfur carrier subunit
MEIKVKYFGSIAEETGKTEESIFMQDHVVELWEFVTSIFNKYGMEQDPSVQVAVNQAIQQNGMIQHGDEIAFLPPYAGG